MADTFYRLKRRLIFSDQLERIYFILVASTCILSQISIFLNHAFFINSFKCFMEEKYSSVPLESSLYNKCFQMLSQEKFLLILNSIEFFFLGTLTVTIYGAMPRFRTKCHFQDIVKKRNKFYIILIFIKIFCIIYLVTKLCVLMWLYVKDTTSNDILQRFKLVQWSSGTVIKQDCDLKNELINECKNALITKFQQLANSNTTNCDLKGEYKAVCTTTRSKVMLIILWFWIIIVLMFCFYSLSNFIIGLTKHSRMKFIKKYLMRHDMEIDGSNKEMLNSFVYKYLKQDGVLMLRIAAFSLINGEKLIFELWDEYKNSGHSIQNYNDIDL